MRNRYEMNPLSLIDGGSRIKITFKNGIEREYENVKDVSAYVAKVLRESDYMINKIEMEKEVVKKEWETLFGRRRYYESESYNPEI
jgi:DNA polymerase I-like protein with 3'-5' exonuclease and polymerase domains